MAKLLRRPQRHIAACDSACFEPLCVNSRTEFDWGKRREFPTHWLCLPTSSMEISLPGKLSFPISAPAGNSVQDLRSQPTAFSIKRYPSQTDRGETSNGGVRPCLSSKIDWWCQVQTVHRRPLCFQCRSGILWQIILPLSSTVLAVS